MQDPSGGVEDATAPAGLARTTACHIADQVAASDSKRRSGAHEDAATIPATPSVGDRQAGDDDVPPGGMDVENPAGVIAADREAIRAGTFDDQIPVNPQLAVGEPKGPGEGGIEIDHLPVRRMADFITQRPRPPVVEKARDRTEEGSFLHPVQSRREPPRSRPTTRVYAKLPHSRFLP